MKFSSPSPLNLASHDRFLQASKSTTKTENKPKLFTLVVQYCHCLKMQVPVAVLRHGFVIPGIFVAAPFNAGRGQVLRSTADVVQEAPCSNGLLIWHTSPTIHVRLHQQNSFRLSSKPVSTFARLFALGYTRGRTHSSHQHYWIFT